MAFQTTNEAFESVFGREQEATPPKAFLDELSAYLQRKILPGAEELGRWIAAGKPLCTFSCREDMIQPIAENLYERSVPYAVTISVQGDTGFILRAKDKEKAKEVCRDTLEKKSRVCRMMTGMEVKQLLAKDKERDKSILIFSGLSASEVETFREKMSLYTKDTAFGLDETEDGTYKVTIFAKKNMQGENPDNVSLCRIVLETILLLHGPSGRQNQAKAGLRQHFRNRLSNGFREPGVNLTRTPLWIVGSGRQFVKVTGNGFEYGHVAVTNSAISFQCQFSASAEQPDYKQLLVSYTERIPDKMATYNLTEVTKHFKPELMPDALDKLDVSPTAIDRVYERGEKKLSILIDQMIWRKIQGKPIMLMDGRWDEKFRYYQNEVASLLENLDAGYIPQGFDPEDIDALKKILADHKLSLSMFENAITVMREMEVLSVSQSVERIADLNKHVEQRKEKAREKRAQEREKKEERSTRSRGAGTGR